MVKRIIRRNNYNQYEKTHAQCIELGLVVNRTALDRFADKLQLIDRAELNKRQSEINQIERAQKKAELRKQQSLANKQRVDSQQPALIQPRSAVSSARRQEAETGNPLLAPAHGAETAKPQRVSTKVHKDMTYEEVKKRETEITFELGEIRIRESELLQELITLSEMLEEKQFN